MIRAHVEKRVAGAKDRLQHPGFWRRLEQLVHHQERASIEEVETDKLALFDPAYPVTVAARAVA